MIFLIGSRFLGAPRKRHPVYPSLKFLEFQKNSKMSAKILKSQNKFEFYPVLIYRVIINMGAKFKSKNHRNYDP